MSDFRTTYVLEGPFEPHFVPTRNLTWNADPKVADWPTSCARRPSQTSPASACLRATACTHCGPNTRYFTLFGSTPTSVSIGLTMLLQMSVKIAIVFPFSCRGWVILLVPGRTKSNTCAGYCSQIETTG